MPKIIPMLKVWQAGKSLGLGEFTLETGIVVDMDGPKMRIKENTQIVFTMKTVKIVELQNIKSLQIDYPKTAEGQDGRGWGILGALVAFYCGLSKGARTYVWDRKSSIPSGR